MDHIQLRMSASVTWLSTPPCEFEQLLQWGLTASLDLAHAANSTGPAQPPIYHAAFCGGWWSAVKRSPLAKAAYLPFFLRAPHPESVAGHCQHGPPRHASFCSSLVPWLPG